MDVQLSRLGDFFKQLLLNGSLSIIVTVSALCFAYFLEYVQGLEPCLLCMIQRYVFWIFLCFALLYRFHSAVAMRRLYSIFMCVCILLGLLISGRHIWLQHTGQPQLSCVPPMEYMFDYFSFEQFLHAIFQGSHDCATVVWTVFGLSIPESAMLLLCILLCFTFVQTRQAFRI